MKLMIPSNYRADLPRSSHNFKVGDIVQWEPNIAWRILSLQGENKAYAVVVEHIDKNNKMFAAGSEHSIGNLDIINLWLKIGENDNWKILAAGEKREEWTPSDKSKSKKIDWLAINRGLAGR